MITWRHVKIVISLNQASIVSKTSPDHMEFSSTEHLIEDFVQPHLLQLP